MDKTADINGVTAAGILGSNESNLPSTPSQGSSNDGNEASLTVVACRQWYALDIAPESKILIDFPTYNCVCSTLYDDNSPNIFNSRFRKVRCDSARPVCKNCARRSDPCEYDVVQKRRGPDRQPGTRQRLYKKKPEGGVTVPKTRRSSEENTSASGQRSLQGPHRTAKRKLDRSSPLPGQEKATRKKLPPSSSALAVTSPKQPPQRQIQSPSFPIAEDRDLDLTLRAVGFDSLEGLLRLARNEISQTIPRNTDQYWTPYSPSITSQQPISAVYSTSTDGRLYEVLNEESYIPRGPSSSFHKQTWWDSLLSLYSTDPTQSAVKVYQDLNFLCVSAGCTRRTG